MQHENERCLGRDAVSPIEIDEISIGGFDALASKSEPYLPKERPPNRLDMPIPTPPGGPKLRHHDLSAAQRARSAAMVRDRSVPSK
jgi:hypothetical protein